MICQINYNIDTTQTNSYCRRILNENNNVHVFC